MLQKVGLVPSWLGGVADAHVAASRRRSQVEARRIGVDDRRALGS